MCVFSHKCVCEEETQRLNLYPYYLTEDIYIEDEIFQLSWIFNCGQLTCCSFQTIYVTWTHAGFGTSDSALSLYVAVKTETYHHHDQQHLHQIWKIPPPPPPPDNDLCLIYDTDTRALQWTHEHKAKASQVRTNARFTPEHYNELIRHRRKSSLYIR